MTTLTWAAEAPETTLPLLRAVAAADGRPELGDDLPGGFRGGEHLTADLDGTPVAYAHLDTAGDAFGRQVVELFVHPDHRRRGIGTAIARAVLDRAAPGARFWSHGDHPGAAAIAAGLGLAKVRELLVMRRALGAGDLPEPAWPEGVTARTFEPGRDEDAVIAVNKAAFDWHPEQGALTVTDLVATEGEPWFDPAGFFLAVDARDRVLGFHWTKVHPDGEGEVYVVGVDPAAQGGGLGKALTLVGLHHLEAAGRPSVLLYVESDNHPAVAVYTRLGFARSAADVQWA
ncbi:mycothiol synthase [Actinokineospora bangkokensis]|uniref:Mycothiol acetyltransferase n=1 Tax=Actinokineospora bangkokensis TaxID=1193682 RepID=A0A1Q9LFQ7_9PSEU|nr:mycothiol synthase [Actinokineospora bangkokensis]OLR90850.1 mycothiol synthase [Actinokineospora bangkokensis]